LPTALTLTADQSKALTALLQDTNISEAEQSIAERSFDQYVELYNKASTSFWAAVRLFGAKDAATAGVDSISALKAAAISKGKTWEPSASTLSRMRTFRHHSSKRVNNYKVWSLDQDKPYTMGEYISFLGRISRGDANEDGTLTEQGLKKANKTKRDQGKRDKAALIPTETFDVSTLFGASATPVDKAVEIMALVHDLERQLKALKLNKADTTKAKVSFRDKLNKAAGIKS